MSPEIPPRDPKDSENPPKDPLNTPEKHLPPSSPLEKLTLRKKSEDLKSFRIGGPSSKKPEKSNDFFSFVKENTKETISYILLIIGILMLFFDDVSLYGELLIGVIFSLYFSKELSFLLNNGNDLIEKHGILKSLMFAGTLLALFIKAPFIFVGAGVLLGIKSLLLSEHSD